jgi:hypothetical protein
MRQPDFTEEQARACEDFIRGELDGVGFDEDLVEALVPVVQARWAVTYTEGPNIPGMLGLLRVRKGWAIRRADFNILKALLPWASAPAGVGAAATVAGASAATVAGVASAAIALIGTAYTLFCDAREKGADLDPVQVRVLAFLRSRADGATAIDVAADLSLLPGGDTTEAEAMQLLGDLQEVPLKSGGKGAFVAERPSGRWVSLV